MAPIRSSPLSYLLLVAGCATRPTALETRTADDARPRRPDAVALDPPAAAPTGAGVGDSRAGVVAVTQPPSDDARALVAALGDAIARENLESLAACLSRDAVWMNPSLGRAPMPAMGVFRDRFRKLDYARWTGGALFASDEAEVLTFEDFDALPSRGPRPVEMRAGDVIIRGRVLAPRAGYDRLFGDELSIVARPIGGRYRIVLLMEDFPLA